MRRTLLLLLPFALGSCAGPDSDPVDVARRFHTLRAEEDDAGMYALLTEGDRAAIPEDAFPARLPPGAMVEVMGWGDAGVDSAALLSMNGDTAAVVLQVEGGDRDTLRLVANRSQRKLLFLSREKVQWRVSMGLAERALLDSLASGLRDARATDSAAVAQAREFLAVAEKNPAYARPGDADAARSLLRSNQVAKALQVELRLTRTIEGVPFLQGRIINPTDITVNTVTLTLRDGAGDTEQFELWDVAPNGSTPIRRMTRLQRGPVSYEVAQIKVF